MVVTIAEAKYAWGKKQRRRGLEDSIEGGIHMVRILWQQHAQEEDWRFLLVDVHNEFIENTRTAML